MSSEVMKLENGVYSLETIEDQIKYANFLISKKLVSETFKDAAQLMVAIQLCKDLKLPNSCLKDFYVIGGKPAIYGDTFVALALGSGVIKEHKIEFYDENGERIRIPKKGQKIFSCVAYVKREGYSEFVEAFYSMDDKEAAQNNNPNFRKYPADMLFRRAMTRAIKWACADAIRGIEVEDYAIDAQRGANNPLIITKADMDADFPINPEDLVIGDNYLILHGSKRGKRFGQIPVEELEDYLTKLEKRETKKKWETELQEALTQYLSIVSKI